MICSCCKLSVFSTFFKLRTWWIFFKIDNSQNITQIIVLYLQSCRHRLQFLKVMTQLANHQSMYLAIQSHSTLRWLISPGKYFLFMVYFHSDLFSTFWQKMRHKGQQRKSGSSNGGKTNFLSETHKLCYE